MEGASFGLGLAIGFSVAAPIGPMGLLCLRRTLAGGFLTGLCSGLGVATADAAYGAVAAFGLTAISELLINLGFWPRLVGGLFLCYLGLQAARITPSSATRPATVGGLSAAYASTAALTLTNPSTILSFAAIFAGLGLGAATDDRPTAPLLVLGVFVGSTAWWLLLSLVVTRLRDRLEERWLQRINLLSGAALCSLGLLALVSAWRA